MSVEIVGERKEKRLSLHPGAPGRLPRWSRCERWGRLKLRESRRPHPTFNTYIQWIHSEYFCRSQWGLFAGVELNCFSFNASFLWSKCYNNSPCPPVCLSSFWKNVRTDVALQPTQVFRKVKTLEPLFWLKGKQLAPKRMQNSPYYMEHPEGANDHL